MYIIYLVEFVFIVYDRIANDGGQTGPYNKHQLSYFNHVVF